MTGALSVGLAGCGKMGSALIKGWLAAAVVSTIDVLDPGGLPEDLQGIAQITSYKDASSFKPGAQPWDMFVLAVKPQTMDEVCLSLKPLIGPEVPVLSIAAGKTIGFFQKQFGVKHPIIRTMPNTPAAIGKGMIVACASSDVAPDTRQKAEKLLTPLGLLRWVEDEGLMDAVTALSGSGPSYVFYLIEALAQAGAKAGLPADLAMDLARQTVIGAAALAEQTPEAASTLRKNVTSPGGTTEAALAVLMKGEWQAILDKAVAEATARSKALSS